MDYEEKYKKLIEAIKEMRDVNPSDEGLQNWISDNVPELAESEDERIRRALIRFHKATIDIDGIKGSEIVSWLEKQGEPFDDNIITRDDEISQAKSEDLTDVWEDLFGKI